MGYDLVKIPLVMIALLASLADLLALPAYQRWLKAGKVRRAWLLLLKPVGVLSTTFLIVFFFGGGFFVGALYNCMLPIVTITLLIVYVIGIIRLRHVLGWWNNSFRAYLLIGLTLAISQVVPFFAWETVKSYCSQASSKPAGAINQAMRMYAQKHDGLYPERLDQLVPEYLDGVPRPACSLWSMFHREFYLSGCPSPNLVTQSVDGMGFDVFDVETNRISTIWSFLDYPAYGDRCP